MIGYILGFYWDNGTMESLLKGTVYLRWTPRPPHPVRVTKRDNGTYIRALLSFHYIPLLYHYYRVGALAPVYARNQRHALQSCNRHCMMLPQKPNAAILPLMILKTLHDFSIPQHQNSPSTRCSGSCVIPKP